MGSAIDKVVKAKLKFGRFADQEIAVSKHIPFSRMVGDEVVLTYNKSLISAIRLDGFCVETAGVDLLDHLKSGRVELLRALASNDLQIHAFVIRQRITIAHDDALTGYVADLNRRYSRKLDKGRTFLNKHYLCMEIRGGVFKGFFNSSKNEGLMADKLETLEEATSKCMQSLAAYNPTRLGCSVDENGAKRSELLGLFFYLVNLREMTPVVPTMPINRYLGESQMFLGKTLFELRGNTVDDTRFGGCLTVKEYPIETSAVMFDGLLNLPHEFVLAQSFRFQDREKSRTAINFQLNKMLHAEDDAGSLVDELDSALDEVASGRLSMGKHRLAIFPYGRTRDEALDGLASIGNEFTNAGIIKARETTNLEPSFWGMLPGNSAYQVRAATISSRNFAGFCSLHNYPGGKPTGNHWGDAVTILKTSSKTPYYFNFHDGDLGNFIVIGRSGSGKTVLMSLLVAFSQQKHSARCIYFDKDRGAEIFIRAIGGRYNVLEMGKKTGMNPLHLPDTEENRAFLRAFLLMLAQSSSEKELPPADKEAINHSVNELYGYTPADRQLSNILPLFGGHKREDEFSLKTRLARWVGTGEYAWVFDNPVDDIDLDNPMVGFDITSILDNQDLATPVMAYMFHRSEERMRAGRTITLIDEGWKALNIPYFVDYIKNLEKVIRKRDGIIGIGTQDPEDIRDSEIGAAIISQSQTMVFFPDYKADSAKYDVFKLTEREIEIIKSLPEKQGWFLLHHGKESVLCQLDLAGMDDDLAVLSGTDKSRALMERAISTVGDDPVRWIPEFHKQRRLVA